MGEKYDGIRFCWHPIKRKLYSRNGNELAIPLNLISLFPDSLLDGELWYLIK